MTQIAINGSFLFAVAVLFGFGVKLGGWCFDRAIGRAREDVSVEVSAPISFVGDMPPAVVHKRFREADRRFG